ncbi:MAG TPA: LPS biosynthesis protein [Elusimicrobia bacterium]|nr:LPS biosynthesis protein [Elusimicrobiota bacterium]
MTSTLSAVLITRDEALDLPACLESLAGLDAELVVLDGGSTDGTQDIAQRFGARVEHREFDAYASQKQAALDLAKNEWVLSIDADERVSPALRDEVRRLLSGRPEHAGYEIPYEVVFMGRVLRFGGLGGERHLRLFRRSAGRFVGGRLHEGIEVSGPVGRLQGRMVHIPYRDVDEYLDKLRRYTGYGARKRFEQGRRFNPLHHLLPFWEFFVRAVLRGGLLDGGPGLAYAALSSFHTWVKYLKLKELETP